MDAKEYVRNMALKARKTSASLALKSTEEKNAMLLAIADALESGKAAIIAANNEDVASAKAAGVAPAMVDRLLLTDSRFAAMVDGVRQVAALADPVGETLWTRTRPSGITIRKVREPFGVVAVVFESRPNVFIDTASLCLKTGNAIILRGGKESIRSNAALAAAVKPVAGDAVCFVDIPGHETVTELVRATGLVDIAIPRGGEKLIRAMCEAALIPVLKHYKGVCHIYVDAKADLDMAIRLIDNAKCQRPSACNAVECVLINENIAPDFLPKLEEWASGKGVTLHGDGIGVEYLSLDLNIAQVADVDEAIAFVNEYSSHHSDSIITSDDSAAAKFLRLVDSAAVYHNVSTRFTDGAEFGMGAEIGISTDKLHARGPMGLEELTTYKYVVTGNGIARQ